LSRRSELTGVSYVVLGLVGEHGAGPHDLVRMMRRGGVYYAVSSSQLYAEPKRLARFGYLSVREEPGQTRARKVYSLTNQGREAVQAWMSQPAAFPRLQHEAAVRVLCADLAGFERVLTSLRRMRPEIERVLADITSMEQQAEQLPHRRANLRLNTWFGRRWCELQLAWLDEAERVLGAPDA
jgi:DNA-binding PadR family transcriptional regulator